LVYAIPSLARTFCLDEREAANARLAELTNLGSSQSPEDMAEEFIFRKFAGLNSAAVARQYGTLSAVICKRDGVPSGIEWLARLGEHCQFAPQSFAVQLL